MPDLSVRIGQWLLKASAPFVLKHCLNGWGPPDRPACDLTHTGGHYCTKPYGHTGRCQCECGSTTTKGAADAS